MATPGHDLKAYGLIRQYIKEVPDEDRLRVRLSMPLKIIVKRYDGQYRNKLVDNSVPLFVYDAYRSKKTDELIVVLKPDYNEMPVPASMNDVEFIEAKMTLLGDRLASGDFAKLMRDVGEATDREVTNADMYDVPADDTPYISNEKFGSW
ncbi:hypothetical protein VCR15J2_390079 [Vibrio coralliirubri]|uniref:hypothetical protein n=1 Tax=Vibrio coralliirubri TaxID=1516159 RepID=UPI0006304C87|nr:hypothetical protein [Vibrio coralliirubri]CDT53489.1 hypothetical protein VCR15J2_390079 [Vibrio coralliirubri]